MARFGFSACFTLTLLTLAAGSPCWSATAAPDPLEVVRSGTARTLDILRGRDAGAVLSQTEVRDAIASLLDHCFDFHEMARCVLGEVWDAQPAEKQAEFVQLFFKGLFLDTYLTLVGKHVGPGGQVVCDREQIEGDTADVEARVTACSKQDIPLTYRLRRQEGCWKVCDVKVKGISVVQNYGCQFRSILARQSFDNLLDLLRKKRAAVQASMP